MKTSRVSCDPASRRVEMAMGAGGEAGSCAQAAKKGAQAKASARPEHRTGRCFPCCRRMPAKSMFSKLFCLAATPVKSLSQTMKKLIAVYLDQTRNSTHCGAAA